MGYVWVIYGLSYFVLRLSIESSSLQTDSLYGDTIPCNGDVHLTIQKKLYSNR
jgi:hypothetical protein